MQSLCIGRLQEGDEAWGNKEGEPNYGEAYRLACTAYAIADCMLKVRDRVASGATA